MNIFKKFVDLKRKPKVVILGSGWGGYWLARDLDKKIFEVTVVSPRDHFLFTPMLPSTTLGALDFNSIIESVRTLKGVNYIKAACTSISPKDNTARCASKKYPITEFDLNYDFLVIACGEVANTGKFENVSENCLTLKKLSDARAIKKRISDVFERARIQGISDITKRELLTFVLVGGGPVNIEIAGELHDFIINDAQKIFPGFEKYLNIFLIERNEMILKRMSKELREFTQSLMSERGVNIITNIDVKSVTKGCVTLSDGREIKAATILWNIGTKPNSFVESLQLQKDEKTGKISTDEFYRPYLDGKVVENIFAIGDCSVNEKNRLKATAQVAQQQAYWLSLCFNKFRLDMDDTLPFENDDHGTMVNVGARQTISDGEKPKKGTSVWVMRNVIYLMKFPLGNKISVIMNWGRTFLFGRRVTTM